MFVVLRALLVHLRPAVTIKVGIGELMKSATSFQTFIAITALRKSLQSVATRTIAMFKPSCNVLMM
jgi:hypothetical protein